MIFGRPTFPSDRAVRTINLGEFSRECLPAKIRKLALKVPAHDQYILRMLVMRSGQRVLRLPTECEWTWPLACRALENLSSGVDWLETFAYLTIRNGLVTSTTDDEWHVDGFSTRVPHLPELNFVWADNYPTECVTGPVEFPKEFDPRRHNVNTFLARRLGSNMIEEFAPKTVYAVDPYVLHRRPAVPAGVRRCFVRLTLAHVEIDDVHNTPNSVLPTSYTRDSVRDFRNHLLDFDLTEGAQ